MKKSIFCLLVITLSGCAALGTKTVYKENSKFTKPLNVGFSQLANENEVNKIIEGSSKIYEETISKELAANNVNGQKINIQNFDNFKSIDTLLIQKTCEEKKLEGIIFSKLKFLNVKYGVFFIPVGVSQDTEVEMQYYNSKGTLLLHTKHNTHKGNSYLNFPSADKTVVDGTKGALDRIFKEMAK